MDKKFLDIVSIMLAVILFILPCGVCAYESLTTNEMEALSVLPFGIDESDMDRAVSRAEFAYMASRLIECRDMEKTDTRFEDVSKENEYSGYVEFMAQRGIINGVTETQFNPDGSLSSVMAYKVFAKILGYSGIAEELGGYSEGYIKIADYLGLTSLAAPGNENLTIKEAINLVHLVLTEEYPVVLMGEKNDKQILYSGEGTFSILGRLKISAYTGYIREVSSDNKTAVFEIVKNNYNTNYIELNRGELKRFNLKNNIDAYHYRDVPVSVCVDENENIIGIKENKHYKIVYTYITAVNGNKNKSAYYAPSAMEYISLADFDEDFDISEKFSLRVAGIERTAQTKICGTFAKVVLSDDEVCLIDSWPVSEGGIITDINAGGIVYTYQNGLTKKLKNVSDYKNIYVYINGKRTDLKELKKNSVFDYYTDDETIMITCSEKVISEVFYTLSDSKVEIGGMFYNYGSLYYMTGDNYKKYINGTASDIYTLFGGDVSAYFGPDGMVRYICGAEEINTGKFYGIILGVAKENISEEKEIKILKIYPEQEIVIGKITNKTIMPALEEPVLPIKDDTIPARVDFKIENQKYKTVSVLDDDEYYDGDGIFVFEKNGKNEIKKISYPDYIEGFDEEAWQKGNADVQVKLTDITSIPDIGAHAKLNGKPYYFTDAPVIAVYESAAGELVAKTVDYNSIAKRPVKSASLVFFEGSSMADAPEFVLLCGKLDKIGDKAMTRGVVVGRNFALDENGEAAYELEVLIRGGNIEHYVVSDKVAEKIPENALISFYKDQLFSDLPIYINEDYTIDISKTPEQWLAKTDGKTQGLQKGTVTDVSKSKLCVENGNGILVNCMHPSRCIIVARNGSHPTLKYKIADITDIEIGSTVYYDLRNEGIETIIVTE